MAALTITGLHVRGYRYDKIDGKWRVGGGGQHCCRVLGVDTAKAKERGAKEQCLVRNLRVERRPRFDGFWSACRRYRDLRLGIQGWRWSNFDGFSFATRMIIAILSSRLVERFDNLSLKIGEVFDEVSLDSLKSDLSNLSAKFREESLETALLFPSFDKITSRQVRERVIVSVENRDKID